MKNTFYVFLSVSIVFVFSFLLLINLFPNSEILPLVESALLITGVIGLSYSVPLAKRELEIIGYSSAPKVVHFGSFYLFKKEAKGKLTALSQTAFNIYGWVVNKEEMKRIIFIHGEDLEGQSVGDTIHVWLPEKGEKEIGLELNALKKALNIQNHIVLIYEDGMGNKYFSLMTENMKYKFGKFNCKAIAKHLNISTSIIESFEIASRYE